MKKRYSDCVQDFEENGSHNSINKQQKSSEIHWRNKTNINTKIQENLELTGENKDGSDKEEEKVDPNEDKEYEECDEYEPLNIMENPSPDNIIEADYSKIEPPKI